MEERLAEALGSAVTQSSGRRPARITAEVSVHHRNPHKMLGDSGYSIISNTFLSRILAPLIAARNITPTESAVLLYCCGEQEKGFVVIAKQKDVADFLTLPRTNVSSALAQLERWHMIRRVGRTRYQVNPTLCFKGNGDLQQEELTATLVLQMGPGDFPDLALPTRRVKKGSLS